jgi:hypothetical protein
VKGRETDLPPLPGEGVQDGSDWLDGLRHGWYAVPAWGQDGWDLMEWPHAAAAHFDGDGRYGLATYEEGDVEAWSFGTRDERDARTDELAAQYWRMNGRGPRDLGDAELAPHHRGPFPESRL